MPPLSPVARKTLLRIAREAIADALAGRRQKPATGEEGLELQRESGAFVTLHRGGELRGCIGTFEARGRLPATVASMARAAAFEDPRFPPLSSAELAKVEVEISVLTPMRRVTDVQEIEVGRHGLCLVLGHRRGVLLPQVATDYGWDRETFLAQTCRKAGLPPDAWRLGAEVYVFEAEVFGEGD